MGCRLGDREASARRISSTLVLCVMPRLEEGLVVVEVSNDGLEYTSSGLRVLAGSGAEVMRLEPSRGLESGGETVTVAGAHFRDSEKLMCRFGESGVVQGEWMSASRMRCTAPPRARGNSTHTVEVSNDGVVFSEQGVQYAYEGAVRMLQVVPRHGHVSGGTVLTVYGHGFGDAHSRLRMCGRVLPMRVLSSTMVEALSPASTGGTCSIEVASSEDGAAVSSRLGFEYVEAAVLRFVTPSLGSERGGALVSVVGEGLDSSGIWCRFSRGPTTAMSVKVQRHSSTLVVCTSPAFVAGMSSLEVVTMADVPSVNRLEYLYHSAIVVESVVPSEGSEDEPHVVMVVGTAFIAGQLRCRVGRSGSIDARWHSSSAAECAVPARTGPAIVPIELSNNGVEYSQSGREFRYVERSAVSGLVPSVGRCEGGRQSMRLGSGRRMLPRLYGAALDNSVYEERHLWAAGLLDAERLRPRKKGERQSRLRLGLHRRGSHRARTERSSTSMSRERECMSSGQALAQQLAVRPWR
jgi:hypothetical protein